MKMIRVYFLAVTTVDGARKVAGSELIHGAVLDGTKKPDVRRLIMDTTDDEHDRLADLAISWRKPTKAEVGYYNTQREILAPDPDAARVQGILDKPHSAVTQPEIWELLRIFGRRHGLYKP